MNKPVVFGGALTVIVAYWYYKRRIASVEAANQSLSASTDTSIGSLINSSFYPASTGQIGDSVTQNYRYSEYQQYLQQGGTQSGSTFDQFLTAAQGQSLPMTS